MKTENNEYDLSITIDNLNLTYDDAGKGKVPVIFLHGFPFDKSMWRKQFDFLKSSHRVIAYDMRGFGQSKDEQSKLSIELFANDLIKFMDMLSIDKAVICGLSMGGYIALNAVNRFPNRFDALILCDTQCNADSTEAKEKRLKAIEKIKSEGTAKFNDAFIKSVFHTDSLIHKTEIVETLQNVVQSNSQNIIIMGLTALAERSETCSTLGLINIPTLILCGREDSLTPPAKSEFMHENIKDAILHVIDNAGHVSNLEQPELFNQYLLSFLNTIKTNEVKM